MDVKPRKVISRNITQSPTLHNTIEYIYLVGATTNYPTRKDITQ